MKVAVLHNHPIHYKHLLFQEMKKAGLNLKVFFVASQSNIRHEKLPLSDDLYSYEIGLAGPYESTKPITRAKFAWTAIAKYKPDVVLISGFHVVESWAAWIWAGLYRRPKILWYESNEFDYPRKWHTELLKRIFLKGCDRAHVYGLSNKAYLAKLGMPDDHIEIKRAVVNVEVFSTSSSEKSYSDIGPKRLMYVGRLAPEKNIGFLLKSLASASKSVPADSLSLTVVGTGPLERELKMQAEQLGITRLVSFVGYCPQLELPAMLRQADFFVLPSTREPWGLVALEAMLCRVPVLISTQCGCAEDLVTPETGWKFSPWDEEQLAHLLAALPNIDAAKTARMGAAAHELAKCHSAFESAHRVSTSILSLVNKRPPRSAHNARSYAE